MRAKLAHQVFLAGKLGDYRLQFFKSNWFWKEVADPRLAAGVCTRLLVEACKGDACQIGPNAASFAHQFDAVAVGQSNISNQKVNTFLSQQRQGFGCGPGCAYPVSG